MQPLHFTLDQVSRELDLPIGVVRQLSRQFEIPKNYYRPVPGQPRLMLFDAAEVSMLEHIQSLIRSGHSWSDVKTWSETVAASRPAPQQAPVMAPVEEEKLAAYSDDKAMNKYLAETTFDEYRYKTRAVANPIASMAERIGGSTPPPPVNYDDDDMDDDFDDVYDDHEEDDYQEEYFTTQATSGGQGIASTSAPSMYSSPISTPLPSFNGAVQLPEVNSHPAFAPDAHAYFAELAPAIPVAQPEPLMAQSPWVTESLKQRARRLQLELLAHSHKG